MSKKQYIKIPNRILDNEDNLNPYERAILMQVARGVDQSGYLQMTLKNISKITMICKNTIIKNLKSLIDKEIIIKEKTKNLECNCNSINKYRFTDNYKKLLV